LFVYTRIRDFLQHEFLFGFIQCMLVDGCDESVPYAYGMYAAIVYVQSIFTPRTRNIYPRTPTFTRDESTPTPADCPRTPTFTPRASTVGADLSCPHITECTLRIVLVHQHLPTYTHCDAWLYLYNSIWTGAMNRPPTPTECTLLLFMYNQCLHHEHVIFTHVHQLWCVIAFIQFGVNGHDESAPTPTECMLRIVHAHQCLSTYTHIYTTCTHCRGRFIVPAYYGIHAAIVHAWLRL